MSGGGTGGGEDRRPRLLFLVTEDWYFWSHRLPMARAARDAGFEVAVATRVRDHGTAIEAEGFRLHPLGWRRSDRGGRPAAAAVGEIARLYRRVRPDLLHHVALKPVVFGSLALRLSGLRPAMVNTLTGLGHVFVAKDVRARALRMAITALLRPLLARRAACVVFQNADDLALLVGQRVVDPGRARLIRGSGIDTDRFSALPPPPETGPMVVALVARMLAIKGVETAVAAVRLARAQGGAVELRLVGAPDPDNPASLTEAWLRAAAAEPGVSWHGHVADVRTVWRLAHVALLPSLGGEGLPKSLLEAAACGRPLVATDVPGCREIVLPKVNGELVPPGDPSALAAVLVQLAADPDRRRRYGVASRQLVETELSAVEIGRRTVDLYREMLAEVPRRGRTSR